MIFSKPWSDEAHPIRMDELQNSFLLLSRTPAVLDAFLRGLPDTWLRQNEGENTMSCFDVVGHLIHGEKTNWMPRLRTILESGETKPLPVFDRWGHVRECEGKTMEELLDEFARLRRGNLDDLRLLHLRKEDLALCGHHPALGRITLGQLLATWTAHDLTHLHQLSRILAHSLRDDVGPFLNFLGVLQCNGHSSS
ncbi:MAG: DinB family protein [Bacillota bacterium]|nr:DinB family protein [Bacillota bacterium]